MPVIIRFFIIVVIIFGFSPLGNAKSDDIELRSIKSQLVKSKEKKTKLEQQKYKLSKDIEKIRTKLIKAATAIRKNEDKLKYIEKRIDELESKKSLIENTLQLERVSIIKLIMILERIRKTPPQAMIARPETPYKTAQSALLMENIIPSVKRHAQNLKNNLETLQIVTNDLKSEKK